MGQHIIFISTTVSLPLVNTRLMCVSILDYLDQIDLFIFLSLIIFFSCAYGCNGKKYFCEYLCSPMDIYAYIIAHTHTYVHTYLCACVHTFFFQSSFIFVGSHDTYQVQIYLYSTSVFCRTVCDCFHSAIFSHSVKFLLATSFAYVTFISLFKLNEWFKSKFKLKEW